MLRITDPVFAMLYRLGAIPEKYFKIIIDRYVETSFAYDPVFEEEELNNISDEIYEMYEGEIVR